MKRLLFLSIIALSSIEIAASDAKKKPVRITSVIGSVPNEYAIVQTTIIRDPKKEDSKPIVQRSEIGRLRPGELRPAPTNFELTVPQLEVDMNVGAITSSIADIAGAINPKAGVAAQAAHTLIDEGLKIASNELNKHYGVDPTKITLLEILPGKYYRVNVGKGEIEVTAEFKKDLKEYRKLMKNYLPVAKRFNDALRDYNKQYREAAGPLGVPAAKQQQLLNLYDNRVVPALKEKLKQEAAFQQYPLHRMALMAVMTKEGEGCQSVGRAGPYKLYLYYYVGAKQTNVIELPFCATDREKIQDFVVTVLANRIDAGIFKPGGIQFRAADNKTITFPVMGQFNVDFASQESRPYSWFDEMVISETADTIESYLFPFDLYKVLATREEEAKKKGDERTKANVVKLVESINKLKGESGKKELEESSTEKAAEEEKSAEKVKPEEAKPEEVKKPEGEKAGEAKKTEEEKPAEKKAEEKKPEEKSLIEKGKELLEKAKTLPGVGKYVPKI